MLRWPQAVLLLLAIVLSASCASSAGDSRAFLNRYAAEWQLTPSPGASVARPRPTAPPSAATPASASTFEAGRVLVFLDPGHGGVDWGTSGIDLNGRSVDEKVVTLALAKQTAQRLQAEGIGVVLSRSDDSTPGAVPSDYSSDGTLFTPLGVLHDLQHRVDRANASGARVLLSFHLNAFTDPAVSGSETFYDSTRPFGVDNQRLAQLVQASVISSLKSRGVAVADRGVTDDTSLTNVDNLGALGVPYPHLVLLGPPIAGKLRASQMAGALSEPLFLSNPADATAAAQPEVLDALAAGYASAIEAFLRTQ